IPAGWQEAEITKSELKSTKAKDGKYIALTFKVLEGEFEKRLVYTNLNIVNKNETAVAIAQSDLKAICEAVGFEGELEDTEDLHNIPLAIKLSVKPETAQWPAKNEIKGFKSLDESPLG
ncbi:MAG: DUF669 domain-containing protein, partial [Lentisphaerae bacterium]|nr:DUF669 domain-containing protein [Lentisphaerota bacterium]